MIINWQVDLGVTARKLKRDWVEKKKIKSIWRRQKQKQGLLAVQAGDPQQETVTIESLETNMGPEDTKLSGEESKRADVDEPTFSAMTPPVVPRHSAQRPQTKAKSFAPSQIDKSHQVPDRSSATHRERSQRSLREQVGRSGGRSIRGKGKQPDMRVKMGKLLEKIKQNHTGAKH
jgi:hypothetical protein